MLEDGDDLDRWFPVYIGLGSNLGRREQYLDAALAALARLPATRLEAVSPVYESEPLGPAGQQRYLNAVAGLLTRLLPLALLEAMQRIETDNGRTRNGVRWGPRTLDLDLLVYADEQCKDPTLTLPHPGIVARAFVAVPLADIAPALVIPGLGRAADVAARLDRGALARR